MNPSECLQNLVGVRTKLGKIVSIKTKFDFVIEGEEDYNYHYEYGYQVGLICKKCGLEVKKMERLFQHRNSNNCSRLQKVYAN